MNNKRNGLLLPAKNQMNNGAIVTGLGFVLYMVLLVLGQELLADLTAIAFGVVGIYVSLSVLAGRRRGQKGGAYTPPSGPLSLHPFLVALPAVALRPRRGR